MKEVQLPNPGSYGSGQALRIKVMKYVSEIQGSARLNPDGKSALARQAKAHFEACIAALTPLSRTSTPDPDPDPEPGPDPMLANSSFLFKGFFNFIGPGNSESYAFDGSANDLVVDNPESPFGRVTNTRRWPAQNLPAEPVYQPDFWTDTSLINAGDLGTFTGEFTLETSYGHFGGYDFPNEDGLYAVLTNEGASIDNMTGLCVRGNTSNNNLSVCLFNTVAEQASALVLESPVVVNSLANGNTDFPVIAITRDDVGMIRIFVNGQVVAQTVYTETIDLSSTGRVALGSLIDHEGSGDSIVNLRWIKGVCLYKANHTPVKIPYTK